jgi:hypothetical protein
MKTAPSAATFVILALVLLIPGYASADSVSIQPPSKNVSVGDSFALTVDIANATDVFTFFFDVNFDPAALSAIDITEGPFLPSGGSTAFFPGSIDNVGGTIAFTFDTLLVSGPGVTGSGVLATIDFTAIGSGLSAVGLANQAFLDSNSDPINVSLSNGAVHVAAVAEPPVLLTMIAGLFFVAFLSRNRARRAAQM